MFESRLLLGAAVDHRTHQLSDCGLVECGRPHRTVDTPLLELRMKFSANLSFLFQEQKDLKDRCDVRMPGELGLHIF